MSEESKEAVICYCMVILPVVQQKKEQKQPRGWSHEKLLQFVP